MTSEEHSGPLDFSRPDHLPQLREDGGDRDTSWLPRQRRGTTPQMIGRYPDYDVFESIDTWDDATRRVIENRMNVPTTLSFFSPEEQSTAKRFCDLVTAQDCEPRVPLVEIIDQKFQLGALDGFHYVDMPKDPETWHRVLRGLDEVARERGGADFAEIELEDAMSIVKDFAEASLSGGTWESMNVARAWSVCTRAVLAAFYSHPWAWNEIGFGGPAYPRGYMRMGPLSTLDPFESRGATSEDPAAVTGRTSQ